MLIADERPRVSPPVWRQWLDHPERVRLRNVFFQIHLWAGATLGMYVLLMSVTGSLLVFRNELSRWRFINGLVSLHTDLLAGDAGRVMNGIGGICLTVVCLTGVVIWWPGLRNWRRGLKVSWGAHFARLNWDLHSAVGFWFSGFVLIWSFSGIYFAFPSVFNSIAALGDARDRYADRIFAILSALHFGRFNIVTKVSWGFLGLIPAVLAFTGVFLCCHRLLEQRQKHPDIPLVQK